MQQLSLSDLDDLWHEFEGAVDATPEVDPWCSGPDWQIPVCTGFAPDAERILLTTANNDGFALLAVYEGPDGTELIGGLEPLWGFGTPILGADPATVAAAAAAFVKERAGWQTLFLPGMPVTVALDSDGNPTRPQPSPDGLLLSVAVGLSSLGPVHATEGITRQIADLDDGYDGWLARRTAKFRRNLRQATATATDAGLTVEDVSTAPDLFNRLLTIERQSWKGLEESGITTEEMATTYRLMIDRLRQRGRLLAYVARLDGRDVGYILGGIRAGRYRGLQLSFADDVRHLSIGNLLQDHQLRQLTEGGLASTYDPVSYTHLTLPTKA